VWTGVPGTAVFRWSRSAVLHGVAGALADAEFRRGSSGNRSRPSPAQDVGETGNWPKDGSDERLDLPTRSPALGHQLSIGREAVADG
jgi:hypothetical protein